MPSIYVMVDYDEDNNLLAPKVFSSSIRAMEYVNDCGGFDLELTYGTTEIARAPAPLDGAQKPDFREISLKLMQGFALTGKREDGSFHLERVRTNPSPGTSYKVF